jgi:hypothetical protein
MPYSWRQIPPRDATRASALFYYVSANFADTSHYVGGLHEEVSAMYLPISLSGFSPLFPTQALRPGAAECKVQREKASGMQAFNG